MVNSQSINPLRQLLQLSVIDGLKHLQNRRENSFSILRNKKVFLKLKTGSFSLLLGVFQQRWYLSNQVFQFLPIFITKSQSCKKEDNKKQLSKFFMIQLCLKKHFIFTINTLGLLMMYMTVSPKSLMFTPIYKMI